MIPRVSTGIPGLDDLIKGGFPISSVILLSGTPGTGKSVFIQQFIYYGLTQGNPAIFVAVDHQLSFVRKSFDSLGWDITKYEENGQMLFVDCFSKRLGLKSESKYVVDSIDNPERILMGIEKAHSGLSRNGPVRIVMDSMSTLLTVAEPKSMYRFIQKVHAFSESHPAVVLAILRAGTHHMNVQRAIEGLVDGIVALEKTMTEKEVDRDLYIHKMHPTYHKTACFPFKITENGIELEARKWI
ncbi:MAG: hypothetical protein KKI07_01610 [Euryarchaeota archaeon]|nr:hypothetical protein [Euryarchaeota archaeon]